MYISRSNGIPAKFVLLLKQQQLNTQIRGHHIQSQRHTVFHNRRRRRKHDHTNSVVLHEQLQRSQCVLQLHTQLHHHLTTTHPLDDSPQIYTSPTNTQHYSNSQTHHTLTHSIHHHDESHSPHDTNSRSSMRELLPLNYTQHSTPPLSYTQL